MRLGIPGNCSAPFLLGWYSPQIMTAPIVKNGGFMSELSRQQQISLYTRLAADGTFRASFEANPTQALIELGVPSDVISSLSSDCLKPCKLASTDVFAAALIELKNVATESKTQMIIPSLRLDFGRK
jgi:putative modified peptide